MLSQDIEALDRAKFAIGEVIEARYLGSQSSVVLAQSTDFAHLEPALQAEERKRAAAFDLGARVRAAIQLFLSSSRVSIELSQKLMSDFPECSPERASELLLQCAEDALAASDAARHAAAVLAHEESPEIDAFFMDSGF
ncbi:conserved hypothetical protein [Burkholderiales bacterium 8X]|nr:conserved hypothetical protein [Burkholderiales bacterium 8X]